MLVLSRQLSEVIEIGQTISIEVIRISSRTVRLLICAPRDMKILRGEITEATGTETVGSDDADDGQATVGKGAGGLVLSRKRKETIVINDDIVITVVKIQGGTVRLGIDAPREITVRRSELVA